MEIRQATIADAKRISEIYSYYVKNTAITFEWEAPDEAEFKLRIENTLKKYPYLVGVDNGEIVGYCYAGPLKVRKSYYISAELSIYLDKSAKGKGYGRLLYDALESELRKIGVENLYACITNPVVEDEYLTHNSEKFHEHLGFTKIAEFHKCAVKFDRYYNMIWMEKILVKK